MPNKIEVNYDELMEASYKLNVISEIIKDAVSYYIKAGVTFADDYEGRGVEAYGTFLKALIENMDKLISCYRITGESITFAVDEFRTTDMNEGEKIARDFNINKPGYLRIGKEEAPKGPIINKDNNPLGGNK